METQYSEILINLNPSATQQNILSLKNQISQKRLKGVSAQLKEKKADPQSMTGTEYLPVIKMILGSTVVASGVKSLFDLFKSHINLQEDRHKRDTALEVEKIKANEVSVKIKNKSGKTIDLKFNSGNEKERARFYDIVDSLGLKS